jgi:hypothetical protein
VNCARCDSFTPHGSSANPCRECRWTGCQVIAEQRERAVVVLGLADHRGLLEELLAHYEAGEAESLRAHLDAARLLYCGMAATDGREAGARV